MAVPRRPRRFTVDLEQARGIVEDNSNIADFSRLKELFVNEITDFLREEGFGPEILPKLIAQRRKDILKNFSDFLQVLTDPNLPPTPMYDVVRQFQYEQAKLQELGVTGKDIRSDDPRYDSNLNDPDETMDLFFQAILEDAELRMFWLNSLDAVTTDITQQNLAEIDRLREQGEVMKKNVVIIGGGPLSALAAQQLSPYYEVTIISEQDAVGEPWRSRPLYINSSTTETNDGPRLPLQDAGTTPTSVGNQLNAVNLGKLLNNAALSIPCSDGTTRQYIAGQLLGAAVATNIALNTSDYILGQEVPFERISVNPDGSKTVPLISKDGTEREITADIVICLTGPGKEVCKIEDSATINTYEDAAQKVLDVIEQNRQNKIDGQPVRWNNLPRTLTLSSIELLYGFWYRELQSNPEEFPLAGIISKFQRVAIIGGGDTAFTTSELLLGDGPPQSYPREFERENTPSITHFNIPAETPEEFAERVRNRYRRVFSDENANQVSTRPEKVVQILETSDELGPYIITEDEDGTRESYDWVIIATGLQKTRYEDIIPSSSGISLETIEDLEQQPVAKGDKENGFYVLGSAAGFKKREYPSEIIRIIDALGVPENTVSLWVNGLLTERALWSLLAKSAEQRTLNIDAIRETLTNLPESVLERNRIQRQRFSFREAVQRLLTGEPDLEDELLEFLSSRFDTLRSPIVYGEKSIAFNNAPTYIQPFIDFQTPGRRYFFTADKGLEIIINGGRKITPTQNDFEIFENEVFQSGDQALIDFYNQGRAAE